MCVLLQGYADSLMGLFKGGSPGCSLVVVLITSFGQAGGFDVRPITSTHATWLVPTLFLFVVCSYLTLALALVCVGDTRNSVGVVRSTGFTRCVS
jgi:hypothetical protein